MELVKLVSFCIQSYAVQTKPESETVGVGSCQFWVKSESESINKLWLQSESIKYDRIRFRLEFQLRSFSGLACQCRPKDWSDQNGGGTAQLDASLSRKHVNGHGSTCRQMTRNKTSRKHVNGHGSTCRQVIRNKIGQSRIRDRSQSRNLNQSRSWSRSRSRSRFFRARVPMSIHLSSE